MEYVLLAGGAVALGYFAMKFLNKDSSETGETLEDNEYSEFDAGDVTGDDNNATPEYTSDPSNYEPLPDAPKVHSNPPAPTPITVDPDTYNEQMEIPPVSEVVPPVPIPEPTPDYKYQHLTSGMLKTGGTWTLVGVSDGKATVSTYDPRTKKNKFISVDPPGTQGWEDWIKANTIVTF